MLLKRGPGSGLKADPCCNPCQLTTLVSLMWFLIGWRLCCSIFCTSSAKSDLHTFEVSVHFETNHWSNWPKFFWMIFLCDVLGFINFWFTLLNSYCFLGSDWSSSFLSFTDKPRTRLISDLAVIKYTVLIVFFVILHRISTVSRSLFF